MNTRSQVQPCICLSNPQHCEFFIIISEDFQSKAFFKINCIKLTVRPFVNLNFCHKVFQSTGIGDWPIEDTRPGVAKSIYSGIKCHPIL